MPVFGRTKTLMNFHMAESMSPFPVVLGGSIPMTVITLSNRGSPSLHLDRQGSPARSGSSWAPPCHRLVSRLARPGVARLPSCWMKHRAPYRHIAGPHSLAMALRSRAKACGCVRKGRCLHARGSSGSCHLHGLIASQQATSFETVSNAPGHSPSGMVERVDSHESS